MYDFVDSIEMIYQKYAISHDEQIKAMRRCLRKGLRPFEYFDCGMYLSNEPVENYIGIREASLIFRKYRSEESSITDDVTLYGWLNHKSTFYRLCRAMFHPKIRVPSSDNVLGYIRSRTPFVFKASNGYGGRGIRFFRPHGTEGWISHSPNDAVLTHSARWLIGLLQDEELKGYIAQEWIEPNIRYDDDYMISCVRPLVFFSGGKATIVDSMIRLKHKNNLIDNFGQKNNAVLGMNGRKISSRSPVVSSGYTLPPMVHEFRDEVTMLKGLRYDAWDRAMSQIERAMEEIARFIDTPKGVLVGFDVLLYEQYGNYIPVFLEGNYRPNFSGMQIANRKGLKTELKMAGCYVL